MPLKVSDGIGAWIKDFKKSDAPQFKGKSEKERRDQAIAAYLSAKRGDQKEGVEEAKQTHVFDNEKDARAKAKQIGGKYIRGTGKSANKHAAIKEETNFEVNIEGLPMMFMSAMGPGELKQKLRKIVKQPSMIQSVKRVTDATVRKTFRLKAQGRDEEEQVDEALKHTHAVIDGNGKVAGMSSNERDAKDIARRHKGRVVKLRKPISSRKGDMMINRPFSEAKLNEGTWAIPETPKQKAELKKLMSKPIKLGKDGEEASGKIYALVGDDELFDALYLGGKKNPNGDARPIIKKFMKKLRISV